MRRNATLQQCAIKKYSFPRTDPIYDPIYVGLQGKVIAIDRFGISAPGNTVMKELGMTKDTVIAAAK
jgi:transketolase